MKKIKRVWLLSRWHFDDSCDEIVVVNSFKEAKRLAQIFPLTEITPVDSFDTKNIVGLWRVFIYIADSTITHVLRDRSGKSLREYFTSPITTTGIKDVVRVVVNAKTQEEAAKLALESFHNWRNNK